MPTFIKSVFLWFLWSPFVPRRRVTMHVEDITDRAKEWAKLTRLEFNARLNEWYNDLRQPSTALLTAATGNDMITVGETKLDARGTAT